MKEMNKSYVKLLKSFSEDFGEIYEIDLNSMLSEDDLYEENLAAYATVLCDPGST